MNHTANLQLDVRLVPGLEKAIDQWLAARDAFKTQPSDESEYDYNATLYDLGAAWVERYPEDANTLRTHSSGTDAASLRRRKDSLPRRGVQGSIGGEARIPPIEPGLPVGADEPPHPVSIVSD